MITINYRGWVQGPTAMHSVFFSAHGNSRDEVLADAEARRVNMGLSQMEAVGLDNREGDWIAAFGMNYSEGCKFMDSPGVMPIPCARQRRWWKFWA